MKESVPVRDEAEDIISDPKRPGILSNFEFIITDFRQRDGVVIRCL